MPPWWTRHNQTTTSEMQSKISQTDNGLRYANTQICAGRHGLQKQLRHIMHVRVLVSLSIKIQLNTLISCYAFYCLQYTVLNVFRLVQSYNQVGKNKTNICSCGPECGVPECGGKLRERGGPDSTAPVASWQKAESAQSRQNVTNSIHYMRSTEVFNIAFVQH